MNRKFFWSNYCDHHRFTLYLKVEHGSWSGKWCLATTNGITDQVGKAADRKYKACCEGRVLSESDGVTRLYWDTPALCFDRYEKFFRFRVWRESLGYVVWLLPQDFYGFCEREDYEAFSALSRKYQFTCNGQVYGGSK